MCSATKSISQRNYTFYKIVTEQKTHQQNLFIAGACSAVTLLNCVITTRELCGKKQKPELRLKPGFLTNLFILRNEDRFLF